METVDVDEQRPTDAMQLPAKQSMPFEEISPSGHSKSPSYPVVILIPPRKAVL